MLEGGRAGEPACAAGVVRPGPRAASRRSQRGGADALDGEGKAVGRARPGGQLEAELRAELGNVHLVGGENAARLAAAAVGQFSTCAVDLGAAVVRQHAAGSAEAAGEGDGAGLTG